MLTNFKSCFIHDVFSQKQCKIQTKTSSKAFTDPAKPACITRDRLLARKGFRDAEKELLKKSLSREDKKEMDIRPRSVSMSQFCKMPSIVTQPSFAGSSRKELVFFPPQCRDTFHREIFERVAELPPFCQRVKRPGDLSYVSLATPVLVHEESGEFERLFLRSGFHAPTFV